MAVCSIVADALRTFEVLRVRVTMTGAGETAIGIEESDKEKMTSIFSKLLLISHWNR